MSLALLPKSASRSPRSTPAAARLTNPGQKVTVALMEQRLEEIRTTLLKLHKTLVDSERVRYEKVVGEIKSPGHFLQLLTQDPWFAWLHPLSLLIVSMDEATDGKEPLTPGVVEALVRQSSLLLVPQENSDGFAGNYFEALQNDPDVVLAHAEATKIIGRRKAPSDN